MAEEAGTPKKAFTALENENLRPLCGDAGGAPTRGMLKPRPESFLSAPARCLSVLVLLQRELPGGTLLVAEAAAVAGEAEAEAEAAEEAGPDAGGAAESKTRQGAWPSRLSTVSFCGWLRGGRVAVSLHSFD